ncbi:hypothetical protein EMMF5_001221 [Cystobasidiomycetes sp. EMM_F5]
MDASNSAMLPIEGRLLTVLTGPCDEDREAALIELGLRRVLPAVGAIVAGLPELDARICQLHAADGLPRANPPAKKPSSAEMHSWRLPRQENRYAPELVRHFRISEKKRHLKRSLASSGLALSVSVALAALAGHLPNDRMGRIRGIVDVPERF